MKKKLKEPIPLTLEQYECVLCGKKFYINKEDTIADKSATDDLVCPFCNDNNVPNVREFDVEILAIESR